MKEPKAKSSREKPCISCGHDEFVWGNLSTGKTDGTRQKVFFREFGMTFEDDDLPISVRRCLNCGRSVMFINES